MIDGIYIAPLFIAMGFAGALSLAVSGFMVGAGLGDVPNARSNHSGTTPTAGGIGLVAGLGGFFIVITRMVPETAGLANWPPLLWMLGAAAMLGLMDDAAALPAKLKFLILAGLALAAVAIIGPVTSFPYALDRLTLPYWAGFAGSALWIFAVVNAVNFMDGSNGLMVSVMTLACLGLASVAITLQAYGAALIPAALAAGLMGFLPYNLRPAARIFSGDVGSLFVGFGFAISALMLCAQAPMTAPVYIAPVLILPFLADVLLTMLRRAKYKENLLTPHKTHLYQRLIAQGHSHMKVAFIYSVATGILAALVIALSRLGYHQLVSFMIIPSVSVLLIYYGVSRRISAN